MFPWYYPNNGVFSSFKTPPLLPIANGFITLSFGMSTTHFLYWYSCPCTKVTIMTNYERRKRETEEEGERWIDRDVDESETYACN